MRIFIHGMIIGLTVLCSSLMVLGQTPTQTTTPTPKEEQSSVPAPAETPAPAPKQQARPVVSFSALPSEQSLPEALGDLLRAAYDTLIIGTQPIHNLQLVKEFYRRKAHLPAWVVGKFVPDRTRAFINCIQESAYNGLNQEDYHYTTITQLLAVNEQKTLSTKDFAALEVLFTDAFLSMGKHYYWGKAYNQFHDKLAKKRGSFNALYTLESALRSNSVCHSLEKLLPQSETYQLLRTSLKQYQQLKWQPIAYQQSVILQKGMRDPMILLIRERLQKTGDLAGGNMTDQFDKDLEMAVRRFQRRHGMHYDGLIRYTTLMMMNVPVEQRIKQLQANLERMRWVTAPEDIKGQFLMINIPEFMLRAYKYGKEDYKARVIVGRKKYPTASFSDTMTYLVFNPYWNMPKSIAREELVPEVQYDRSYLDDRNIEAFLGGMGGIKIELDAINWDNINSDEYFFRQGVNAENPMGIVKFMFPNSYSIYLHDTPTKHLFANSRRTHSHGCMRVHEPLKLAEYLLKYQPEHWSESSINKVLENKNQTKVVFQRPVPIHVRYHTTFIDEQGDLNFREDIYNWDERLSEALMNKI